jgi:hypothetical protein
MDLGKFLLTILTFIIAIIGKTFRTEYDDEKHPGIKKFTPAGKWALIALCLSTIVTILYDINKKINDDNLKELTRQNDQLDKKILQQRYDSTAKALADAKIALLELQKSNAVLLYNDSSHFRTTLHHFGMQLDKQEATLTEVSKVLHPLFPLNITYTFVIDFKRKKLVESDKIDSCIWALKEAVIPRNLGFIRYVKETDKNRNGSFTYQGDYDDNNKDFGGLISYLKRNTPAIRIIQLLVKLPSDRTNNLLHISGLSNPKVFYNYDNYSKSLTIICSGSIDSFNIKKNTLYSYNDLNKTILEIEYTAPTDTCNLKSIKLESGIHSQNYLRVSDFDSTKKYSPFLYGSYAKIDFSKKYLTKKEIKDFIPYDIPAVLNK